MAVGLTLLACLLGVGSWAAGFERPPVGLVAMEQSPLAELRVVDLDGTRYMLIDGGIHTIVEKDTFESEMNKEHTVLSKHKHLEKSKLPTFHSLHQIA